MWMHSPEDHDNDGINDAEDNDDDGDGLDDRLGNRMMATPIQTFTTMTMMAFQDNV